MKIAVRGGYETAFDDSGGAGRPLVLVHGFPLDRRIWAAQVRGLRGKARVIAPDLRGFGETPPRPGPLTIDAYALDVRDLLDELAIESAVIGGVSMGGYVALAFHRHFPHRVRGLVLVDTRAGADSLEARRARDEMAGVARMKGAGAVASRMLPKMLGRGGGPDADRLAERLRAIMEAQPVEAIAGALGAMRDRQDATESLASIRVPALVVTGAEDQLIAPAESRALADSIPDAHLEVIPGAGHLPNFEKPDAFDAVLTRFLARLPEPAHRT